MDPEHLVSDPRGEPTLARMGRHVGSWFWYRPKAVYHLAPSAEMTEVPAPSEACSRTEAAASDGTASLDGVQRWMPRRGQLACVVARGQLLLDHDPGRAEAGALRRVAMHSLAYQEMSSRDVSEILRQDTQPLTSRMEGRDTAFLFAPGPFPSFPAE